MSSADTLRSALHESMRQNDQLPSDRTMQHANTESIRSQVAQGVTEGVRALLEDEETMKQFWRSGYEELITHGGNGASQWLGKRILTWLIGSITLAGLVWLVKSGAVK